MMVDDSMLPRSRRMSRRALMGQIVGAGVGLLLVGCADEADLGGGRSNEASGEGSSALDGVVVDVWRDPG